MKTPTCDIPSLVNTYTFTMKDGNVFKAHGFNLFEAFTSVEHESEWPNIVEWVWNHDELPPQTEDEVIEPSVEYEEEDEENDVAFEEEIEEFVVVQDLK